MAIERLILNILLHIIQLLQRRHSPFVQPRNTTEMPLGGQPSEQMAEPAITADTLVAAAQAGDSAALEALCRAAEPDVLCQANAQQDTPLHWAAFKGLKEACEILLQRGVGLELRGDCQNTPLHLAAAGGQEAVAALLLYHGADLEVKNSFGNMPIALATHQPTKQLLRRIAEGGEVARERMRAEMDAAAAALRERLEKERLEREERERLAREAEEAAERARQEEERLRREAEEAARLAEEEAQRQAEEQARREEEERLLREAEEAAAVAAAAARAVKGKGKQAVGKLPSKPGTPAKGGAVPARAAAASKP